MSGRGILDADMQTLGRMLAHGWRWWVEELAGTIPVRFRRASGRGLKRLDYAHGALAGARAGMRMAVAIPASLCLTRRITRPRVGDRDLREMLALEAETLFPFPAGDVLLAARRTGEIAAGRAVIEVAGLPIEQARAIAAAIETAKSIAVRVALDEPPLDFAPAMRRAGLLGPARSAAPWLWGLVIGLVLLNIAVWIWRDSARVAELETLVQEQRPAVAVAQTITRRAQDDRALVARSLALRRQHDALGTLADVAGALPEGAWLQRYSWDGRTVRLAGYRPASSDMATALRRSGRFADVRSEAADAQAALPFGDPFDISSRRVPR